MSAPASKKNKPIQVSRRLLLRDLPPLEPTMPPPASLAELQIRLGHQFRDPALLEQALTHASLRQREGEDNETLEFLGDRVLGLIIARTLFARGEALAGMAERFKFLVSGALCARIAHEAGMVYLLRSDDSLLIGEKLSPAIAADLCEAVIAAIYLDAGLRAARAFVLRFWKPHLSRLAAPPRDAKSLLQEAVQKQNRSLPMYKIVRREGPRHGPRFVVKVEAEGLGEAEGEGSSRRAAEQEAAAALLTQLNP